MILDIKRAMDKISSGDGEIVLEAWDSRRKILVLSVVKEHTENFSVRLNDEDEIRKFIDHLSMCGNVKMEQIERLKHMLSA